MRKIELVLLFFIFSIGIFIRFYNITVVPPGLYQDEVAIGYNANMILHTGKDEYGISYPLFFKSFGDYKNPVYIYATALSIALFGENDFAIRFPSAIAGALTILVFYFFLKDLLIVANKKMFALPFVSSFLLAISPWHIQFSRAGFEVNFGLFFLLLGLWFFILFYKNSKRIFLLFFSFLTLTFTMYIYHIYQIICPILIFIFSFISYRKFPKAHKELFIFTFCIFLLILPLTFFTFFGNATARFNQTSAFAGYSSSTFASKLIIYPLNFFDNYKSFFSLLFLFVKGDTFGRHQMTDWGLFYHWQLPFLIIGIYALLMQYKTLFAKFILSFLFIIPIAGALVLPSPHSLRSLPMVLPLTVIIAIGIIYAYEKWRKFGKVFVAIIMLVGLFELSMYLDDYYIHYPKINALDWGAGYKQMVQIAEQKHKKYTHIVIDKKLGLAKIYFSFYDSNLQPFFVGNDWKIPENWKGKTLYIRPYGIQTKDRFIEIIRLPDGSAYAKVYTL